MARRPPHLRWIYVKDHALLFSVLAALFVAATVASALMAGDPTRGLLLGMIPTSFAFLTWALTNRAGYPNRDPQTLAHERPMAPEEAAAESRAGDPFSMSAPVPSPPKAVPSRRRKGRTIAKPPAAAPAPAGAPPPSPGKAPNRPTGAKTSGTTGRRDRPKAGDPSPPKTGDKPFPKKALPKKALPKKATPGQPTPRADRTTTQGRKEAAQSPPKKAGPDRSDGTRRSQKAASTPPPANPPKQSQPPGKAPTPGSAGQAPPAAQPPSTKRREPTAPSESARDAIDKKHRRERSDASVETPTPVKSVQPGPALSPAEAAKRDAEERKSRKRKGKPDEAA